VLFRIITLNLRYGTAPDEGFSWIHRRERAIALLQESQADVIGTQEGLYDQLEEIRTSLPGYKMVGVGREDGHKGGEFSAIFFREWLSVLESGSFWLSDRPETPGSRSYGNTLPRIATWIQFTDPSLLVINAHLDHESSISRVESIRQITEFARQRAPIETVVMGDFNVTPDDSDFHDVYRGDLVDAQLATTGGTFHGFSGDETGDRIDYILHSHSLTCRSTQTLRNRPVYSDHDAVVADFELRSASANG
jgi:endonuclease/exonuclease/phosphatase family metal-dependent hydrolase